MPSKKSATAIPFCKICHRKMEKNSFFNAVFTAKSICLRCFLSLKPTYYRWKENGTPFLAIYPYGPEFQSLIYQYKGCGDIELSTCFLERVERLFRLRFHGYRLVYAPSHRNKIEERGFDHVPLMFEGLKLTTLHAFIKTEDMKQSNLSKSERKKVGKHIKLVNKKGIRGAKILLVDDIFTTGSTIRACLRLLLPLCPKKVFVLLMAKVPPPSKKALSPAHRANMRA
ncbi:MAG: ComF family protein [Bacilli bacterium]|nr:ComF family protein [Bacilli bacterium]